MPSKIALTEGRASHPTRRHDHATDHCAYSNDLAAQLSIDRRHHHRAYEPTRIVATGEPAANPCTVLDIKLPKPNRRVFRQPCAENKPSNVSFTKGCPGHPALDD